MEGQRILRFGLPLPEARGQIALLLHEAVEECR
jgi:hypothetical protein